MTFYNTAKVAEFLGLTPQRVGQLEREGIITPASPSSPGLYSLRQVTQQYITYLRDGRNGESQDYKAERTGWMRAKREIAEMELAALKGDLHASEDITGALSAMVVAFKTRLMAIPSKQSAVLSKETSPTAIHAILDAEIREALQELAQFNTWYTPQESKNDDTGSVKTDEAGNA